MLIIEVNNGFCRKPFECDYVPVPTFTSFFVDVTNVEPKPDEYWTYNYSTKKFTPPPKTECGCDIDYASDYMIKAKWNDVRNQRNIFLMESDWTQLPDSPLSWFEKQKWKTYRKYLRDIPQKHIGNPVFVQFPPKPSNIMQAPFWFTFKKFVGLLIRKK